MFQNPRGTRDILPPDQKYFNQVLKICEKKAQIFGFLRIETPVIEEKALYDRTTGSDSDIVQKEMFELKPKSDQESRELVLRPEFTPGIGRAYLQYGMSGWPQPVRLYTVGSVFRYSRPQKGRLREFRQSNFEVFGDSTPGADGMIILVAWQIFEALKLTKFLTLEINTIGDKVCKDRIKRKLSDYFKQYREHLCKDCQNRLKTNPLRILDCKENSCQTVISSAPQIVDLVCDACRKHFTTLLEYLDEMQIPYNLNPRLVRGLDYYNRTVFEIIVKESETGQSALAGGGRYDELVSLLDDKSAPGIGFAIGIDRAADLMIEKQIPVPDEPKVQIALVQLGEKAKYKILELLNLLTKKGFSVVTATGKDSLKAQLRMADKSGARLAVIIGQREAFDKTAIIRNLDDSSQVTVKFSKIEEKVKNSLKK